MSQPQNHYKADLRDFEFLLFEQFRLDELLSKPPFENWGRDEVRMALEESCEFAQKVLGPLNVVGDRVGCKLENGRVITPPGFKEAWKALFEAGWRVLSEREEVGGQGAPHTLQALVEEMFSGANCAFMTYPGLAIGAVHLIDTFGTPELKRLFVPKMYGGKWGGTMCLTEPQAGSDVGAATTSARRNPDGTYSIKGTKIFITGGDHDCAENIVHLVLARVEGAPPGTKGLSLFVVPKIRVNPDGSLGEPNDVKVIGLEHKMGLHGSATCVLQFGEEDRCIGYLCGTKENEGIRQMFQMMNYARIGVGVQGLAVASAAYLCALDYAKERKQGSSVKEWKNPLAPRVPIIEHPDIRRMLLEMKSKVEGIRALIVKLTMHQDRARVLQGKDDDKVAYHLGQVDLLTPIVKAYGSEQAFRICELAMQVYGGAGYIRDYPIEQYMRDSRVFSIYEGTNHIQALDLVGRKLTQDGGRHAQAFISDMSRFIEENGRHPVFGQAIRTLGQAKEALANSAFQLLQWFQSGEIERVPLHANRFLEMMSETAVGWLLLDAAIIADEAQQKCEKGSRDWAFYEGKKQAALFFASTFLPEVPLKAQIMASGDRSALEIPVESFAMV
ncbi:MAG: acyl-CoA dehydrogenase [Sandaracinaceae bacterium]|nr:acyl-CoA dehydrogenase [Sandaracinaceae bacterium]